MKLVKQVTSIVSALCMAVALLFVDIPLRASEIDKDKMEATVIEEKTDRITISNITIADTYYSVNGKFPIYVEFSITGKELTNEQKNNIKLVVAKEDGTQIAECPVNIYDNYGNYGFSQVLDAGISNGDKIRLEYSIIYNNNGEDTVLWSDIKETLFENKDNWASRRYLPTNETGFSFYLYFAENMDITGRVNAIYLFDENDNIAAQSREGTAVSKTYSDSRYDGIFNIKSPGNVNSIEITSLDCYAVYRTRKLKPGEKLYAGYNDNGTVKKLEDVVFTVTDQPYVESVYSNNNLYPGIENAAVIEVTAYNMDFSKLSITLRNRNTGKIDGKSVNYIEEYSMCAYFCIKWDNENVPNKPGYYDIEYSYADSGKNVASENPSTFFNWGKYNKHAIWNSKTDSIEYYNKEIPSGADISYEIKEEDSSYTEPCVSGSAVKASEKHVISISLEGKLEYNKYYYLFITYIDNNGQEKTINTNFYTKKAGINIKKEIYHALDNNFFIADDNEIEFIAKTSFNEKYPDESKLENSCSAVIYKHNTGNIAGTLDLLLEKGNKDFITYCGKYEGKLEAGAYDLEFFPNEKWALRYIFYIYDNNRLYIDGQANDIINGNIHIYFNSDMAAEWYFGERHTENMNKLKVKILDIDKQEIGTYRYADNDFTIINGIYDEDDGIYEKILQFTDKVKQNFTDIYYCYVYLYYGDGNEENTIATSFEYEDFYNNTGNEVYIRWEEGRELPQLGRNEDGVLYQEDENIVYDKGINTVIGNKSIFPVTVKVTDWYSLETLKEITIQEPGHIFTKTELEGLSPVKGYNLYLKGTNGATYTSSGYLDVSGEAEDGKQTQQPSQTPSPTPVPPPTLTPPIWTSIPPSYIGGFVPANTVTPVPTTTVSTGGSIVATKTPGVGNSGSNISSGGGGGAGIAPVLTATPSASPHAATTPAPSQTTMPKETDKPEATTQPETTTNPEATAAPAATAPPAEVKEPETPVTNNPYVPSQEEKPVLKLKKNKITLKKGQKAKIKITSKLATNVIYKSLKPSVATVSKKGVITAKKEGKAVITVKANGLVKKVQVTVKKASKTKDKTESTVKTASSVKLNKNFKLAKASVTLKKGKKLTIKKASGLSGKVTFRSLDKKIASVSVNGVVKAKKKGKTTILIKKGNKTIKLKITVKK